MARCFETDKKESFLSKIKRWGFNIFPAYYCSGGKVRFISDDWKEIHVSIGLKLKTRNYVGTVFGGSSYGALDPMYMIQLIQVLGPQYVVWDKAATVQFIRPVSRRVCARFLITDTLIDEIKKTVADKKEMTLELPAWFEDKNGKKYVEVDKTLYIADKAFYKEKRMQKKSGK
jgi:acyl-coenzyme A thioesterase PaaI-like protein